jgi:hypothetical protein
MQERDAAAFCTGTDAWRNRQDARAREAGQGIVDVDDA